MQSTKKHTGQIFPLMFAFGRLMRRKAAGASHLTMPQLEALSFICEAGAPLMREVARHLHVTAPTATAVIDELAKAGYVARVSNPADRREVRVEATAKGSRMLARLIEARTKIIGDVLSVLSRKDREDFVRIITRVVTANR